MLKLTQEKNSRGNTVETAGNIASLCIALILGTGIPMGFAGHPPKGSTNYVTGRVLVQFQEDAEPEEITKHLEKIGAKVSDQIPEIGVLVIELPTGMDEREAEKFFKALAKIRYAELDFWREPADSFPPSMAPSDPYYSNQWHLSKMAAPVAWNTTTGSASVKIAILDTGIDGTHPDLQGRLLSGWNFYDNNADTSDVFGHGTAVAGTAAASSNNSIGVASLCWGCGILPIRVSDANGWATDSAIANALTWAADQGAKVANISFAVSTSSTVTNAAQYFQNRGGVVTVSAGNDGTALSAADNPYMLTVGATDSTDALATFSNTGNLIDLVAPGVNVYTTSQGGNYAYWSGTSFSAPIVAGAAALLYSANPSLNGIQVQNILKQTADDLGPAGWDASFGGGRVNADRAMSSAMAYDTMAPSIGIVAPLAAATVSGTSVSVQVSASDNAGVATVTLAVDGALLATLTNPPFNYAWNTTKTANGTRTLQATARDAAGNSASTSIQVTVKNTDRTAPTASITSPVSRATVSGFVTVKASASDNYMVASVSLVVDGVVKQTVTTSPYSFTWDTNTVLNGSHTLAAKAFDGVGNATTSTAITVTVNNPDYIAPTISITTPADGTKTTLSKLSVTHKATDNQKVTKVELYVDGVLKVTSTTSPFTISWTTVAGTHKLQSKAYDAANNIGLSQVVTVTK